MNRIRAGCAAAALFCGTTALAATSPQPAPVSAISAAPAVSTGSLLQMLLGLAIVLAMVVAGAWLMKRFSAQRSGSAGAIRIIAGTAVGPRERVVLLEVADTWLVIGVAPGRVNALHTLPRAALPDTAAARPADASTFIAGLRRILEQRNAR